MTDLTSPDYGPTITVAQLLINRGNGDNYKILYLELKFSKIITKITKMIYELL